MVNPTWTLPGVEGSWEVARERERKEGCRDRRESLRNMAVSEPLMQITANRCVQVREDKAGGIYVEGASSHYITTELEVWAPKSSPPSPHKFTTQPP
eukprot:496145-Rhodomonas_salina.1